MSKIRTIKPEFWTSESIMSCSKDARLLFIGLLNFCDDAGIHPASPLTLKAEVMPCDDIIMEEFNELITELMRSDLIFEFSHNNKNYWQVVTFREHQFIKRPNYKYLTQYELESVEFNAKRLPSPVLEGSNPPMGCSNPPVMEGNGMEGNGRERINNNPPSPKTEKPGDEKVVSAGFTFQDFIEDYPKKVGQRKMNEAANIWKSQGMEQHGGLISKSIRDRIAFSDWREKIGTEKQKFIPGPVAFLQDRLFEKEFERVLSDAEKREMEIKKIEQECLDENLQHL